MNNRLPKFVSLHFAVLMFFVLIAEPAFGQQNAKQVDPQLSAMIQKARMQLGQGNNAAAEKILLSATIQFPKKPGPWYLLGYALQAQKKYDAAISAYQKSLQSPRLKINAKYNLACIYSLQNQTDKAIENLESAIADGFANFGQLEGDADFANIKHDPRFEKLLPKKLSDAELFVEPTTILQKWVGETTGDQFGWIARKAGDINQDGKIDVITTAPTFGGGSGKAYIYSSASGKLLQSFTGKKGEQLGNSAVGIGDVNDDGIPDVIVGAPSPASTGKAYVFSGKDGTTIYKLNGNKSGGQFGYEVSGLGDIDGDKTPDFLVGAMAEDGLIGEKKVVGCGRSIAYSGKSGKLIFELFGERTGDAFGNAASASLGYDGKILLAIGAKNAGPNQRGRVFVYEIENAVPKLKFTIEGNENSVNLGQMFISFPGDLDRDKVPDVFATDFSDNSGATGGGKVVVHSGATGKQLLAIQGTVAGEGLGTSPSDAGDVDGDGIGDLVIGAWQNSEGAPSGGKVYLYSGVGKGKLLRSWTCRQSGDTLGFDATGIGDVNDDGKIDFLLTSAWSNAKGPKTGRVFIVSGEAPVKADASK